MWVINSAYYFMFFGVIALLAKKNKKITEAQGVHKLTYHAFVFFYDKIKQNYLENYKEAIEDINELLQLSESKTDSLIFDYSSEIGKRKQFTYHMGEKAELSKAKTSVKRARDFLLKIEELYDLH